MVGKNLNMPSKPCKRSHETRVKVSVLESCRGMDMVLIVCALCADGLRAIAINSRTESFETGLGLSPGFKDDILSRDPVLLSGKFPYICYFHACPKTAFVRQPKLSNAQHSVLGYLKASSLQGRLKISTALLGITQSKSSSS